MLCMKRVHKKMSPHWSADKKKQRFWSHWWTVDKPQKHDWWTAVQKRVNCGFRSSFDFPGHALHEKGLLRQKSVVPLVGSKEQRALFVPVINRGSTADFVSPSVYIGFRLFVLLEKRLSNISSCFWMTFKRYIFFPNMPIMRRVYKDK